MKFQTLGSNPAGDINFHIEFFSPFPFSTAKRSHANEIKHQVKKK